MTRPSCWIVTEGHAGMESQCRGLAQALDLQPIVKRVRARLPWDWLPARLWFRPLAAPAEGSDPLTPPWPDLVISQGNVGAPLAAAIRRVSAGKSRAIHLTDPKMPPARFDLVIAPRHDRLTGANVVETVAQLHPLTPVRLAEAARAWEARFAQLKRPLVAVLIGGGNRRHRLTREAIERLTDGLARMMREHGAGFVATPSRRTDAASAASIGEKLASLGAYVWDGRGDNPYLGMLALADAIVVTEDSVAMASEAAATGKPVYIARLDGHSRRIGRFHALLAEQGVTRRFDGSLARWTYAPPDDMARAVAEIRRRFAW